MGRLVLFFVWISLYAQEGPKPHPSLGRRLSDEDLKVKKKFRKKKPGLHQLVGVLKNGEFVYGQVIYKNNGTIAVSTTPDWSRSQTSIGQPYKKEQLRKLSS